MQRNKRHENLIIVSFFFFLTLLIILWVFNYKVIYRDLVIISDKKSETRELYASINEMKSKWVDFWKFNNESKNFSQWVYLKEILKNLEKEFFDKHFINKWTDSYKTFLDKKIKTMNSPENKKIKELKKKKVSKILPSYSEYSVGLEGEYLTDFKFINYIESLLETFNLDYTDPIWIKEVVLIDWFSNKKSKGRWLENEIFYIPLKLNLIWNKENMINFLHFLWSVWNITVEEDNIEVKSDNFLVKESKKIMLEWYLGGRSTYNIYENQLINVSELEIQDYIDSSYTSFRKQNQKLSSFVKNGQWNQKMEIDVTLKFYIKWLKNYKIEEIINKFLFTYTNTGKIVNKNLKSKEIKQSDKTRFETINSYLKEISDDVKEIRKDSNKKDKLKEVYKKVSMYDLVLYNMNLKIWIQNIASDLINKYKQLNAKQDKTKKFTDYLNSIKKDILDLKRNDASETENTYLNRLNTKEMYDKVMKLSYELELNNK